MKLRRPFGFAPRSCGRFAFVEDEEATGLTCAGVPAERTSSSKLFPADQNPCFESTLRSSHSTGEPAASASTMKRMSSLRDVKLGTLENMGYYAKIT
jgi:hypothetical protein